MSTTIADIAVRSARIKKVLKRTFPQKEVKEGTIFDETPLVEMLTNRQELDLRAIHQALSKLPR